MAPLCAFARQMLQRSLLILWVFTTQPLKASSPCLPVIDHEERSQTVFSPRLPGSPAAFDLFH